MDESLVSLVDETQTIEENNYLIEMDLTNYERNIYSWILFVFSIIINLIFVIIYNENVGVNLFLNLIYILSNCGVLCLTYKNKYLDKIKDNLILIILLLISIIFDIILSLNNNENKLTLIFIFMIKNVIIGCYIKYSYEN